MQSSSTQGQTIVCKAAVAIKAKEPMKVMDVNVAPPKAGEVRVKVIANALCHTDIYTLSGSDPEGAFPSILGHEATAIVESIGEGVTNVKVGDYVVPCYTPECMEWDCKFCQSEQTNLCPKIRATQGKGVMPDGTSRFTDMDGNMIYHFMGCSTFSEYTVLAAISCAKINDKVDMNEACLLGCGVSTGWGTILNNPNFKQGSTVAVWGLGAVGLSVVQAAKYLGAGKIYGIDINESKYEIAKEFGCDDCQNPLKGSSREWLLEREKWGIDFTFDCTGNVKVMREALESAHRGYGESCVVGVAAAGQELATRPFQLVTGRVWKGTAFGGWKSRQDVPKLVNKAVLGDLPLKKYITHQFGGLEKVQDLVDALHGGECLRGVLKIDQNYQHQEKDKIRIVKSNKLFGGMLKKVSHWSECNQCEMTFNIYLPEDNVKLMRRNKPYPTLYYLSGMTCNEDNAVFKSGFGQAAKKHDIVMVFPDTSPRGLPENLSLPDNWKVGAGTGFYCNATTEGFDKHYNMYTYITKELPELVSKYFFADINNKSVFGHSMGGGGALQIAMQNPTAYKSVSAFSPMMDHLVSELSEDAKKTYFKEENEFRAYNAADVLRNLSEPFKMPGLIDTGSSDEFMEKLAQKESVELIKSKGHNISVRYQDGYDHSYFFVSSFMGEHIDFHAARLSL